MSRLRTPPARYLGARNVLQSYIVRDCTAVAETWTTLITHLIDIAVKLLIFLKSEFYANMIQCVTLCVRTTFIQEILSQMKAQKTYFGLYVMWPKK